MQIIVKYAQTKQREIKLKKILQPSTGSHTYFFDNPSKRQKLGHKVTVKVPVRFLLCHSQNVGSQILITPGEK